MGGGGGEPGSHDGPEWGQPPQGAKMGEGRGGDGGGGGNQEAMMDLNEVSICRRLLLGMV